MTRLARRSLSLLIAVAAVAGCRPQSAAQPSAAAGPPGPAPVPVVTGQVVRKSVPLTLKAIGRVEPIATVAVRARVGGELTRVWFTEGDLVRQGQTLFTIDPRPYRATLDEAEARLARNQALLKKAEADEARYAGLVKQDYVTKEQYDQVLANVASLKAQLNADQATIEMAKLNLSYCTITAPVSGRTGNLLIKAGNLVRANDDRAMVTINQIRPIYVSFSIPAQYLGEIQRRRATGITVMAFAPEQPDTQFTGTLSFIDNAVDTPTSTILLKGTFQNEREALWPGQFVSVLLTLGEEADRIVAPAAAVQTGQQGTFVFLVGPDGTAEMRLVKVTRQDEREAVIESGLTGGETVVTEGHLRVVPGAKVRSGPPPGAAPSTSAAPETQR
jgi:multidrug efflux system membrane fusion protein